MTKKQFRALVVRAIEDAIILFLICVGIWVLAYFVQTGLELLGVI